MSDFKLVKLIDQIPLSITIDNDGILNNLGAVVAPAVTDDSGDGYSVGSRWIDVAADEAYIATDVTVGAAVWVKMTVDAHSELSGIGTNTHAQIDSHIADSTIHFTQGAISIPSTQISDFNEAAQDAVGAALTDTSSIDLTYNDGANTISGVVLPAGVDHNSLANLTTGDPHTQYALDSALATVATSGLHSDLSGIGTNTHTQIDSHIANANIHVDHTAVTLAAGTGLSGGGDISANRTFNVDLNDFTTDTPATADFIPFYDTSGADSNKSTIANMQIAFWQTAPNVAHVKADGTGSHATIVAANADASIVTIILYPGTHSVDNSAGFITLTKAIMSFGGKNRATISRTTNTNVCFRVTSNSVQIQGVGFSGGTSANPFFLEIQTPATFTQAIYSDIQLAAGINGILVRTANGVSLEKITGFTTTTSIQVGDASSSFAPTVIIRNCGLSAFNVAGVLIYQCTRCDITASSIVSGTAGGSTGVSILSTCTGDVNTTACTFTDSENHIVHEGSGIYTSSSDTFKNHTFGAVNSTAGTGTVIMNGSTISYDPIGFGNTDFALATSTTLKGYYFDAYIGELINVADSRSYRDISNLRWAFMFGGNT